MKQLKLINLENVSENETRGYKIREAAKAIVFDENNLVALLYSTKNRYYKLPGGGVEKDESYETALKRECVEEIGCEVEIINELGVIVEYRKKYNLKQTSYCYLAKVKGKKGVPKLEPDEIEEGFETVWHPIQKALQEIKNNSNFTVYEAPYMVTRDTAFLEEATKF